MMHLWASFTQIAQKLILRQDGWLIESYSIGHRTALNSINVNAEKRNKWIVRNDHISRLPWQLACIAGQFLDPCPVLGIDQI